MRGHKTWTWAHGVLSALMLLGLLWWATDRPLPQRSADPPKRFTLPQGAALLPDLPFTDTPLYQAYRARQLAQPQGLNQSPVYPVTSAHDGFAARVYLIRTAQRQLDLQYYIWNDDVVGRLLLLELQQAARRGVRVRLLLDDNNTRGLDGYLSALSRQPNFEVRLFNPFMHRQWRLLDYLHRFQHQQKRMHNKVLVADQAVLITGGRNVGDSYFRPTPAAQSFTDLDVIAAGGPAVQAARFFEQYWHGPDSYPVRDVFRPDGRDEAEALQQLARSPRLPESKRFLEALQKTPLVQDLLDGRLQWIWAPAEFMSDLPDKLYRNIRPEDTIPGMIAAELRTPSRQLDLVSAYFIPTEAQVQQLVQMARRGVRIRVLTNSLASTDVPLVHAFYLKKRRTLLQAGIRLFEYSENDPLPSFGVKGSKGNTLSSDASLHAKVFSWDQQNVFVGSFNYDPRSLYHNTECGLLVRAPQMAREIDRLMDGQLRSRAYEVKLDAHGQLYWVDQTRTPTRIWHQEPRASLLDRVLVRLAGGLPIEPYL